MDKQTSHCIIIALLGAVLIAVVYYGMKHEAMLSKLTTGKPLVEHYGFGSGSGYGGGYSSGRSYGWIS